MTDRPDAARPGEGELEAEEPGVADEPTELDADEAEAARPEVAADDGDDETRTVATPIPPAPVRPTERGAERVARQPQPGRVAAPPPSPSEQAVHIGDRASQVFVLVTVLVFVLILLNGVLFGVGGVLTPIPSPTPRASLTPAPSVSPAPSASPALSPSPSVSAPSSPAPSPSPAPSS